MADDVLKPIESGDTSFKAETTPDAEDGGRTAQAKQTFADGAGKIREQAYDKARAFAEDGKAKATGALDQLAQMLTEAATSVDDKLGDQYGQYARSAAGTVSGFADQVKGKDVDALIEDARGYVRQSPAVAIGLAAAFGFVAARLIQSGVDAEKA